MTKREEVASWMRTLRTVYGKYGDDCRGAQARAELREEAEALVKLDHRIDLA